MADFECVNFFILNENLVGFASKNIKRFKKNVMLEYTISFIGKNTTILLLNNKNLYKCNTVSHGK